MDTARATLRRARRYAVAPALAATLIATAGAPSVADPVVPSVDDASQSSAPTDDAASRTAPADDAATTSSAPTGPGDVRPRIAPLSSPLGQVSAGPVPDADALAQDLEDELGSRWLGPSNRRAVAIRDALTGESLLERNGSRLVTPASTTKLLSAAAIMTGLEAGDTFTTRVVAGEEPGEVVLVAGGDMLLADGRGNPEAVAGHAGIADLAAQTAAALQGEQGGTDDADATAGATTDDPVTVSLDLSYAAAPHAIPTWTEHWVAEGWTGRVVQLGRADDRARPYNPSPAQPEQEVARVFRAALEEEGVDVAGGDDAEAAEVEATDDARELATVESAAVRDVLALALATSDNAMVEQLARQAAVAAGVEPDQEPVMTWVEQTLAAEYHLELDGVQITDASGLSDGTRIPVDAVAEVLVQAAHGEHPELQEVLAAGGLPIAGYTGTLATRFHLDLHDPAVGNARAKTGTLPGVTSLAGTVVTADGRLLVYAMTADDIDEGSGAFEAASVLDEVVAELARCGC